jgi:hypothetical protein
MARISYRVAHRPVFAHDALRAGIDAPPVRGDQLTQVRMVSTRDLWILEAIDHWQAAYRMAVQDGAAVVAEIRLFPAEPHWPAGEWSGVLRGLHASVPRGGITARLLRRLRLGAHVLEGRHVLVKLRQAASAKGKRSTLRDMLRTDGLTHAAAPQRPKVGGRKPSRDLDRVATVYRAALEHGDRAPVQAVARALGIKSKAASNAVDRARTRGLLSPTTRGRMRA